MLHMVGRTSLKPKKAGRETQELEVSGGPYDFPGWLGVYGGGAMEASAAMESIIPYNQMNALRHSVQNHLYQNVIFVTL